MSLSHDIEAMWRRKMRYTPRWSLYAYSEGSFRVSVNKDEAYSSGMMIAPFVCHVLLNRISHHGAKWKDNVYRYADYATDDDGVKYIARSTTVYESCYRAIVERDRDSLTRLIDYLGGVISVNESLLSLGYKTSRIISLAHGTNRDPRANEWLSHTRVVRPDFGIVTADELDQCLRVLLSDVTMRSLLDNASGKMLARHMTNADNTFYHMESGGTGYRHDGGMWIPSSDGMPAVFVYCLTSGVDESQGSGDSTSLGMACGMRDMCRTMAHDRLARC